MGSNSDKVNAPDDRRAKGRSALCEVFLMLSDQVSNTRAARFYRGHFALRLPFGNRASPENRIELELESLQANDVSLSTIKSVASAAASLPHAPPFRPVRSSGGIHARS